MKTSELVRATSGSFKFRHVWAEFKEIFEEFPNILKMKEEVRDTFTTACLWLFCEYRIDMTIPTSLSAANKYITRMIICEETLREEGLFDPNREEWYFAAYTSEGTNMERPHKRDAFLKAAREDKD